MEPNDSAAPDRHLQAARACCPISTPQERLHVLVHDEYTLIGIPESDRSRAQEYGDAIVATVPAPVHELPEFSGLMALLGRLVTARRANPDNAPPQLAVREP